MSTDYFLRALADALEEGNRGVHVERKKCKTPDCNAMILARQGNCGACSRAAHSRRVAAKDARRRGMRLAVA
jgi:hypothetical protein